jgi:hypothetical protein
LLGPGPISANKRYDALVAVGQPSSRYRERVYAQESFSGTVTQDVNAILALLDDAQAAIDHSIATNRREDGMYHAYNLLDVQDRAIECDTLYPMLEGQVAALSAGSIEPAEAVTVIEALFASDVYREDQKTFMLYPDRALPAFLEKNRVPETSVAAIPLLKTMLDNGDERIICRDADGHCRFNGDFANVGALNAMLDTLVADYGDEIDAVREQLGALYEEVFNHQEFTGRSGGMFAFEGLGSIYWHMVSKLLLAVQENFFHARQQGADDAVCHRLGELYYLVREGIGFNKTPAEYGAFPTDPYSHTPKDAGAKQPGMTGQVKEEVLTRFGELGIRVDGGAVQFHPALLRQREFVEQERTFRFLDIDDNWQEIPVPAGGLAFTWCQVPIVYELADSQGVTLTLNDGNEQTLDQLNLPPELSTDLFERSGRIRQITVRIAADILFAE